MDTIQLIILLVTMLATVLGVVIPLHLQNLTRLDAIQQEMKDFHGKLCAIEEKIKK